MFVRATGNLLSRSAAIGYLICVPELDLFRRALLENPFPTAVLDSSALISTSEFPFGLQMLLYVL